MVPGTRLYLFIIILYLCFSYSVFLFFNKQTIISLGEEDGLLETLGAVFFLLASILFFIKFWKEKSGNNFGFLKTRKNLFFLLLCILLFFGFGEEISWGQRIFNFQTPETLKEINIQGEFNIHNINIFNRKGAFGQVKSQMFLMLNMGRLFSLFWLFYCVLIPLLNKFNLTLARWFRRINLPIVPLWLGIFFLVNYLVQKVIELYISNTGVHQTLVEIKECGFALLFFLVGFYFLYGAKSRYAIER